MEEQTLINFATYVSNKVKNNTINDDAKVRFVEIVLNYGMDIDDRIYDLFPGEDLINMSLRDIAIRVKDELFNVTGFEQNANTKIAEIAMLFQLDQSEENNTEPDLYERMYIYFINEFIKKIN